MARLVADKKATQIGVSNYGPKTLRTAFGVVEKGGGRIFSNQVIYKCICVQSCQLLVSAPSSQASQRGQWHLLYPSASTQLVFMYLWVSFSPVPLCLISGSVFSLKSVSTYIWPHRRMRGAWNSTDSIFSLGSWSAD